MQFRRRRELKRTKIEIIPMIDTMFFLLVFFMLSSLSLTRLDALPVNLPRATTSPSLPAADLTLTIDGAGKMYVNRLPVTQETLPRVLREQAGGPGVDLSTATVTVNADRRVPHGEVVAGIDAARTIGISRFAIATDPYARAR